MSILLMTFLLSFVSVSNQATAQNFSVDFKQAANNDNPYALGNLHWINSILQQSNSRYAEGMSTLQRIIFTDLANCNTGNKHVLRVKLQANKAQHHSYDFITSWDQALVAASQISPAQKLMPLTRADVAGGVALNECGQEISATAGAACTALTGAGPTAYRDIPVDLIQFPLLAPEAGEEENYPLTGDLRTVRNVIASYEARFGQRTVRVYAPGFTGATGDVNNRVEFVEYSAGYIYYDIKWTSTSPNVMIEFGAHIANGIDPLNAGIGYGPQQGASDINGGPYHVILEDFQPFDAANPCEGNLGNQDNQLKGADVILQPSCVLSGPPPTICTGVGNQQYNATVTNADAPVYLWTIENSNQTTPATIFSGQGTAGPVFVTPGSVGHYTVQLRVTNNGGLTTTCTWTTEVTCPTPTISSAGPNATIECTATPSFTAPTTSDACGGSTVQQVGGDVTGGTACAKTTTRTWRAVNSCGNSSSTVSQTITQVDTQAPTIGAAGGPATIECTATPSFTAPTASDACNTYTVQQVGGDVTGGTSCAKTTTRTWRAVDACGNASATRAQTITQVDTQAPAIGAAGVNATVDCTSSPSFTAPTASDACNTYTVQQVGGDVTGGTNCAKTTTRTWRAVDACGNVSATRAQTITQIDNQAPVIGAAGANATIECTATPSFTAPTASDVCNTYTVQQVGGDVTGGTSCAKTTTRTWNAVDACGNTSATRAQTITQVDSQAPVIGAAGANATIECTATPSFTAPTASDACNTYTVQQVGGDVTGGTSCAKTTTRTWRAVDFCGNASATRAQTITQVDTQAPTIGAAGANATVECTATPSFTAPTASDACNTYTVQQVGGDVTGGTACAKTTTRTWNAVDACGNTSATRSQTITQTDSQAPTIGAAGANATIECTATPSFTAPTASDNCGTYTVQQVGGDVTGGTSCAKTTTRTWNAVDACGNTSATRAQTITQVDSQAPVIGAAGANATIECTATPSFTAPTASDACNTYTVQQVGGDVTGGTSCAKTTTRTWRAVDFCGNTSATRAQTITQVDTQAPTIGAAGANATIECTATPSFTAPTASDACNTYTVQQVGGDVTGGTSCAKTTTRTWRAVDFCGNASATRAQTITQVDTQAPVIGAAGANATIDCASTPRFTAPTASDACNTYTVTQLSDVTAATGGGGYTRTVTWRATDACGNNSVTRAQIITVEACLSVHCTYTQGAYGTTGGTMCDGEIGTWTTLEFINNVLTNYGGSFSVGKPGNSVLVNSAQCVIDKLPGGGGSKELAGGDVNLCVFTPLQNNGGVKNILLAQTITLGLNLGIENSQLGGYVLQAGILATADPLGGCGDDVPTPRVCNYNPLAPYNLVSVTNEYTYRTFYQNVIDAIPGANTVANLYELANRALANVDGFDGREGGVSIDSIQQAVASVNEVFDECKVIVGWNVAPCAPINPLAPPTRMITNVIAEGGTGNLTVSAYPNPFRDNVRFVIQSPVSGQATLEVFNNVGQRIQVAYNGIITAGRSQVVEFKNSSIGNSTMIYKLRVGDQYVTGKLISIR